MPASQAADPTLWPYKVHVDARHIEQVVTVGGLEQDPRGWSVSTLYYALLPGDLVPAAAGISVDAVDWCDPTALKQHLAFDHHELLQRALAALRHKVSVRYRYIFWRKIHADGTAARMRSSARTVVRQERVPTHHRDEPALQLLPDEFLRGPQRLAQLYCSSAAFNL